jgi:hypothetical protein
MKSKYSQTLLAAALVGAMAFTSSNARAQPAGNNQTNGETNASALPAAMDRTVLPIPDPKEPTYTELDARKVKPPLH